MVLTFIHRSGGNHIDPETQKIFDDNVTSFDGGFHNDLVDNGHGIKNLAFGDWFCCLNGQTGKHGVFDHYRGWNNPGGVGHFIDGVFWTTFTGVAGNLIGTIGFFLNGHLAPDGANNTGHIFFHYFASSTTNRISPAGY